MKNTTITLITAMILVTATIGTFFMEMISKEVLTGALTAIILPALIIFNGFKWAEDNAKELAAKSIALATAEDYREIAQMEVGMERPIITRDPVQKVERAAVFAS